MYSESRGILYSAPPTDAESEDVETAAEATRADAAADD